MAARGKGLAMAKSKRLTARDFTPARVDLTHLANASLIWHSTARRFEFDNNGYPYRVPVLTGKDVCQGKFFARTRSSGPACLLGHGMRVFDTSGMAPVAVCNALLYQIRSLVKRADSISRFNDIQATPALAARVWNAAMASLGYTEGNPEAKNVAVTDE